MLFDNDSRLAGLVLAPLQSAPCLVMQHSCFVFAGIVALHAQVEKDSGRDTHCVFFRTKRSRVVRFGAH